MGSSEVVKNDIVLEACVESLEEALKAEKSGASQLEFCANLEYDGLTPSIELVKEVIANVTIPVKIMIRPRSGDFVYSDSEFETMCESIQKFSDLGIKSFVTGMLKSDNSLDINKLQNLVQRFEDIDITIHKCIDQCQNIHSELDRLRPIGQVKSILSSGKSSTAVEGIPTLRKMNIYCGNRFNLIVAGKVTQKNIKMLKHAVGAKTFHGKNIM